MDWTGGLKIRILAGLYLVTFALANVGVVWILLTDAFDRGLSVAFVPFVAGALGIQALAYVLRDRVPPGGNRLTANFRNSQRAYHRLALGLELARAWRALIG
jgi:hypothetical protein